MSCCNFKRQFVTRHPAMYLLFYQSKRGKKKGLQNVFISMKSMFPVY